MKTIKFHTKADKKTTLYLKENLKKIWINLSTAKKMRDIIDETYYNLCALWLYWDIYYKLQTRHWIINDLLDDEYVEEDEIAEILSFYNNHFKD